MKSRKAAAVHALHNTHAALMITRVIDDDIAWSDSLSLRGMEGAFCDISLFRHHGAGCSANMTRNSALDNSSFRLSTQVDGSIPLPLEINDPWI